MLALREVEQRLGIAERLATCIDDPRLAEQVRHEVADILRFRMLMIAAGYEDGNDADSLRRAWGCQRHRKLGGPKMADSEPRPLPSSRPRPSVVAVCPLAMCSPEPTSCRCGVLSDPASSSMIRQRIVSPPHNHQRRT